MSVGVQGKGGEIFQIAQPFPLFSNAPPPLGGCLGGAEREEEEGEEQ